MSPVLGPNAPVPISNAPLPISNAPVPVSHSTADPRVAPETVMIPTDDGGYVTVREATKVVEFGGEEVELRRLTPEEKQRKRLIRNIFMAAFGLLFLGSVALVLILFM